MASVFFSYSHIDEALRDMLEKHLSALKHQGLIETWHDRRIDVGTELDGEIDQYLNTADIILLLVSSDFIGSKYCYDVEMKLAIERHNAGEAKVVPVILRPCDWQDTPFGSLLATPTDGKAVTSWANLDEAFLDIVKSIKLLLRSQLKIATQETVPTSATSPKAKANPIVISRPRSANLRTKKSFSESDKDKFLDDAFGYIATFFEGSLEELSVRNDDLTTRFKRVDANSFAAVIYQNGDAISRCKIRLGGFLGNGISYSANDHSGDNSFNENMSIECDDQHMYLKPLGMATHMGQQGEQFTFEGAAEYYWSMLMNRLQ